MVKFTGKFVQTFETNYQNFLQKIGCGPMLRNICTASTPTMEIIENKGKWKFVTSTVKKSQILEFELVRQKILLSYSTLNC